MIRVARRLVADVGSCQECHGSGMHVYEFNLGGFVARLCAVCMNSLVENYHYANRVGSPSLVAVLRKRRSKR